MSVKVIYIKKRKENRKETTATTATFNFEKKNYKFLTFFVLSFKKKELTTFAKKNSILTFLQAVTDTNTDTIRALLLILSKNNT